MPWGCWWPHPGSDSPAKGEVMQSSPSSRAASPQTLGNHGEKPKKGRNILAVCSIWDGTSHPSGWPDLSTVADCHPCNIWSSKTHWCLLKEQKVYYPLQICPVTFIQEFGYHIKKHSHALFMYALMGKKNVCGDTATWSCSSCILSVTDIKPCRFSCKYNPSLKIISRQEAWAAQLSSLCGGQFTQKAELGISTVSLMELYIVVGWTHKVCWRDMLS